MTDLAKQRAYLILILSTFLALILVALLPAFPQWPSYHQFADTRNLLGVPNFWNVVSNLGFMIVGVWGLVKVNCAWHANHFVNRQERVPFVIIFVGLILTSLGSSYYHLAPDNDRLVWDRIPMTIVFMAFLSFIIMERVNFKVGYWLLFPLILVGIGSVWYWNWTEHLGRGDLRFFAFIKFYSVLFILMMLYFFPKPYPSTKTILFSLLFYGIATLFESLDWQIFKISYLLSGHTLKHLFSALGAYWFIVMVDELKNRI